MLSFDANYLLGFGEESKEPLPRPRVYEIVIRYGGWSLMDLHKSEVVRNSGLLSADTWYAKYGWSRKTAPPGVYRLHMAIPDSMGKTYEEQKRLLTGEMREAEAVLVVTAMILHEMHKSWFLTQHQQEPWETRCLEENPEDFQVCVCWVNNQFALGLRGKTKLTHYSFLWMSSIIEFIPLG